MDKKPPHMVANYIGLHPYVGQDKTDTTNNVTSRQ